MFDWLRRQPAHAVFDWGGADNELRFTQDDITKLMADCIECKIWVPMGASAIALRKREDNQAPRSEVQRYTR